MKKLLVIYLLLTCTPLFSKYNKWLKNFDAYKQSSYFKTKVYEDHTVVSFYKLEEIRQQINPDSADVHLLNACLFFATNKLRAMYNLRPYGMDENLKTAAVIHSYQMAQYHFFDHVNPYELPIKTLEDRLKTCGILFSSNGENCHHYYIEDDEMSYIDLAQKAVESFYKSPPHRSNLLDKTFNFGACGTAIEKKGEDFYLLVTQNFYNK